MPWLGAGLPNIDSAGAGREQPLQLIVLFPVGGIHIDVQTQLAGLGLISLVEDDRGLRATEADARRPDLYACFDAFQLDIAQYLAPEPRQQFGITCVQDQFGYATCHLITIASHAADRALRTVTASGTSWHPDLPMTAHSILVLWIFAVVQHARFRFCLRAGAVAR
jgi:hypothetical protein